MINMQEVLETNNMIAHEKLDVRTITMGISLLDCVDSDLAKMNGKIYNKITTYAKDLVSTGDAIGREFGVPIVNKRISVTPIALVGGSACKKSEDFVEIAKTLDKAAKEVGVNFIGGYSALVSKGMTPAEELLIPGNFLLGAGRLQIDDRVLLGELLNISLQFHCAHLKEREALERLLGELLSLPLDQFHKGRLLFQSYYSKYAEGKQDRHKA